MAHETNGTDTKSTGGGAVVPIIGTMCVVLLVAAVVYFAFSGVDITDDWMSKVWPLLGSLFVIALFMERAIDVFLSAFRAGGADMLDLKISIRQKELSGVDRLSDPGKKISAELENLLTERSLYRVHSRQWAQWGGLLLGLLVAFIGFHALESLVDPEYVNLMKSTSHYRFFIAVDVLLTGALLAGGSNALNQIMKVYSEVTSTATEVTRAKKKQADTSQP